MASILDQYESAQAASTGPVLKTRVEPLGPGFIDARLLENEVQIFSRKKINFKPDDSILQLAVCNNFLMMAMADGTLMRLDLEHPDDPEKVELYKPSEDRVVKMFLDPTGRHSIFSMKNGDHLYLCRNSKKPRPITKLKGEQINSVGWNWQNTNDNTTGAILLGTSKGNIYETEMSGNEDSRFWQSSLEQYFKQLYSVGDGQEVTGLEFDRMPSDSMTEYQYYILATTSSRLYQFIGTVSKTVEPPMFLQLFANFEGEKVQFQELPGSMGNGELHLYFSKFRGQARNFAWMAGPGVYYGALDTSGKLGPYVVLTDQMLMRYPKDVDEKSVIEPLAMVLTEFHILLLFQDRLKAFCRLNEQQIFDEAYSDRLGKVVGLWRDPLKGVIWLYTTQSVFKYKVTSEDRDVWQMYLDKGEFELAKDYCRDNLAQLDKVFTKQAEVLFTEKRYVESAEMYAQTQNSFEEVALKFIRLADKDALRKFVNKKLDSLKSQDKTQMTMLVTWLIEIYLNQMGELKEQGFESSPRYKSLQTEFQLFLKQTRVKECVGHNKNVVYDLISSHGDIENLVYFAMLMQDYEKVIYHYIQIDNYKSALIVLAKQSDVELFYKFSPLLIQYIPKETVNAWITQGKQLDPKRLIPALVQYDHTRYREQGNEVIRYLEYCILEMKNRDQAIHNYILSLYAKLKPDKLMDYLEEQDKEGERHDVCYDRKYALRLCLEYGHKKECVHIYSLEGLYEEAVDLALSVDVELAKTQANKPDEEDIELRKKLWLRIARHVVEEQKDVKRAMDFLHECELLKIEDILPFFPDFVTIDHFKDAIITSLQAYNQHIDTLKEEMDEATESAEEIRKEIHGFRNKYAQVQAQDKCTFCSFPLMSRSFYLFPCQHKFHSDCLIAEVLPNLGEKKSRRVEDLQRKMAERDENRVSSVTVKPETTTSKLNVKAELDDLVASECIYCGDLMIRSIDKPFVDQEDNSVMMDGWV